MKPKDTKRNFFVQVPIPQNYLFAILTFILLLLGIIVFEILPDDINTQEYKLPVLSFLAAFALTGIGNIVLNFIQKSVSKEANRALNDPIVRLEDLVDRFQRIQIFYEKGVVGIFPNRLSAMEKFIDEIKREDKMIAFIGTSLQGILDPEEENEDKREFRNLLIDKRKTGVRIRALLMHPAYGEFREKTENRGKAAVAKDIQNTLRYLIKNSHETSTKIEGINILTKDDVRLYPGVTTAFAIITRQCMLINPSSLYGPAFDNFSIIIKDTEDANSIYKKFKANHFEEPWKSEKTIRINRNEKHIDELLKIDFGEEKNRFKEGEWKTEIEKILDRTIPTVDE